MATDTLELPDNATHEQIVEVIDQLVVEQGKESGAPSPDEKVSDDKPKEILAGDDVSAGDDSAATDKDGEDRKEDDEPNWLDDDLRAEVSTLGISDEQLSEFGSREELDRAMRLLDAAAIIAGRKAGEGEDKSKNGEAAQLSEPPPRGADGKFLPKEEAGYKVQLDPETYDEEVVKEFNSLRDHYESRLGAFENRFAQLERASQEREEKVAEERFDSIVDSLDHADLFGESGKESKEQLANRQKLFDEHQVYLAGLKVLGREGRTDKAFVTRVLNMTFAERLTQRQQEQLTHKMSKQSRLKLGRGTAKPADRKYDGSPENDPDLLALYKELDGQSG